MRVVIIEDELHNQRLITGMLKQLRPKWNILATLESVKSAVQWFSEFNPLNSSRGDFFKKIAQNKFAHCLESHLITRSTSNL